MKTIHIIFTGSPGPEGCHFIECEKASAVSFNAGEWRQRDDGFWELIIDIDRIKELEE